MGCEIPQDEPPEIARWFMRGQRVGRRPLFDGICSMCGTLLYGNIGLSGTSNKVAGLPIDRDGVALFHPDGSPQTCAQPPCFLRFSPQLFAREAPETVDGARSRASLGLPHNFSARRH